MGREADGGVLPIHARSLWEARKVIDNELEGGRRVLALWDIDDTLLRGEGGPRGALTESADALALALAPAPGLRHLLLTAGMVDDCFTPAATETAGSSRPAALLREWAMSFEGSASFTFGVRTDKELAAVVTPCCKGITTRAPPAYWRTGQETLVLDQVTKMDVAEGALASGHFEAVVLTDNNLAELECVVPPPRRLPQQEADAHFTDEGYLDSLDLEAVCTGVEKEARDPALFNPRTGLHDCEVFSMVGPLRCAGRALRRVHYRPPEPSKHKVLPGELWIGDEKYESLRNLAASFGNKCLALSGRGLLPPLPAPVNWSAVLGSAFDEEREELTRRLQLLREKRQGRPEAEGEVTQWRKEVKHTAASCLAFLTGMRCQLSLNGLCRSALFGLMRAQTTGADDFPKEAWDEVFGVEPARLGD
eukprot:Hpha_TRINITY_DN14773_c0_g2::TRINITY_DN14773_c0_g2_i1::g.102963::m.102963